MIQFQATAGQVTVNNQTKTAVVVNNVSAGGRLPRKHRRHHRYQQAHEQQSPRYVYHNGTINDVRQGAANQNLGTGTPSGTISGSSINYNPTIGLRYQWSQSATMSRSPGRRQHAG